jgi:hypothetical protein
MTQIATDLRIRGRQPKGALETEASFVEAIGTAGKQGAPHQLVGARNLGSERYRTLGVGQRLLRMLTRQGTVGQLKKGLEILILEGACLP